MRRLEQARKSEIVNRGVDRLGKLNSCFLDFGADPLENIGRLTAVCGELLGAACALYNRLDQGMLCSLGRWNAPADFNPVDRPDGHICYDVIRQTAEGVLVISNLPETPYARTDPNVIPYKLRTYIGTAVKLDGTSVGSLCAVFQTDYVPGDEDKQVLQAIAKAIAVEEERKRATEALRESNETLRALIQASPLAIVTFDPRGHILMWNPAAERMFGWRADEVLGRPHPIVPEDKREEFRAFRDIAMRGEAFTGVEVRRLKKDGSPIDISISTAPLRGADGAISGIMSIITDVTERKITEEALRKSEEQLLQAQKMEAVGRLAGGIAHDFNNLLTAVTGYSELLLARIGERDPMWKELEEIRRAGVRAASLTRQLLAFSRRQVLQVKVLDLNAVVSGLESMLRRLIGEDIELIAVAGEDLGRVRADQGQIEQVIMNLVVNARDAMRDGGRITIRTGDVHLDETEAGRLGAVAGSYVVVSVGDNGSGMNEEVRLHLFEPFFTTKEDGTGLGLATAYGIVRQSGGHIRVDSEPGRGSTFEVYLPRVEGKPESMETHADYIPSSDGRETVLVVEDEEMVRELVCEVLRKNGYTVLEAQDGEEALRVSGGHRGPIHLLVTDMVMPRMRGNDLAERLVPLRPEMKVLYMSGYTGGQVFGAGGMGAGQAFMQKPFGPAALAKTVRRLLDSRSEDDSLR
ncbi:MAG TPA: PAS domain S-box protein [Candidatus Deferrimicrobiaceae bacterium]